MPCQKKDYLGQKRCIFAAHASDQYSPQKNISKKPYHIRCFPIIMIKILKCSQNNIRFLQCSLTLGKIECGYAICRQAFDLWCRVLYMPKPEWVCLDLICVLLFSRYFLHSFIWNTMVSLTGSFFSCSALSGYFNALLTLMNVKW